MSMDLFESVVPAMKSALEVYLFGDGEALLDVPRHLAMVSRVRAASPGCSAGFSTNGKLLTPEVYRLYAAAGIDYIQFSIDAAAKGLYEAMRRGGDFDELIANLDGISAFRRAAKSQQPRLHLATVISRQNYRELPALAEMAKRYGFAYWYISAEYPHNPGRDRLRLNAEDLAELERIRAGVMRDCGAHCSVFFDWSLGLRAGAGRRWIEGQSPVYCTAPWQRFELKANGDVKVCPYYHEPICSMDGKPVWEVWNGPEFRQIRRAFASRDGVPSYCVGCQSSMRRQYLEFPAILDRGGAGLLARALRRARGIGRRIRIYANAAKAGL